jgi:predicted peptidase
MAGFSDPQQLNRIKNIAYWIFHGDRDEYNPVAGSRKMHELLKAAGADVRYTEYAGANHGESFTRAFNQTELIPWLFSKNRKKKLILSP